MNVCPKQNEIICISPIYDLRALSLGRMRVIIFKQILNLLNYNKIYNLIEYFSCRFQVHWTFRTILQQTITSNWMHLLLAGIVVYWIHPYISLPPRWSLNKSVNRTSGSRRNRMNRNVRDQQKLRHLVHVHPNRCDPVRSVRRNSLAIFSSSCTWFRCMAWAMDWAINARRAPRVLHRATVFAITRHRCTPMSVPLPASTVIDVSCCAPNWSHMDACTRASQSHASSTVLSAPRRGQPSPICAHTCAPTIQTCRSDPLSVTSATRRSSRAVISPHTTWCTRERSPSPAPTVTSPIKVRVI